MSKHRNAISPDQLGLSIVEGQLLVPEPDIRLQEEVTDMLPHPRNSTENAMPEKIWPDAVDLGVYRRSMLDLFTPIGEANRSQGFATMAAQPHVYPDIPRRYGQNTESMKIRKSHEAKEVLRASQQRFYVAQGLGNLAAAQGSELTIEQIRTRVEVNKLWQEFADTYVKPGAVQTRRRKAYIKSLQNDPMDTGTPIPAPALHYAPDELMLRLA